MVKKLRSVARGCLWKHLIFSFRGDLNEDYPMAMVSYGTIFRINKIDSTSLPVIREWIRKHAKIGAAGEGRVFGDGTYTLLQVHTADIVTEIEDSELCPGNDTIDASKFNYFDLPQTWSPIQTPTQAVEPTPVDQSQAGNPSRATIQQILNRHNSLVPSTEAVLPSSTVGGAPTQTPTHTPTHTIPVVEILDQGQDLETVLPTEKVTTLIPKSSSLSTKMVPKTISTTSTTSTTSTPTSKMHIILAEGKTIGPTTTTLSSNEEIQPEEIVHVEPEVREEVLEETEDVPTTILPTTTSSIPRLIVGTPPAETAVPSPIYSLDDNYDGSLYQMGSFDGEEVDLEVAKQETLVEIKKSESFWAFLSCAVLIIGMSASDWAKYKWNI